MILLCLGLILICVLVFKIYESSIEKESFVNAAEEALEKGERAFLQEQDDYYDVRKQGIGAGLLETKPGINTWYKLDEKKNLKKYVPKIGLEQKEIGKKITNCRALTKCGDLGNNGCGYCAYDKEFRFGDANGPTADVCPKKAWTTDAEECTKLREKEICSKVKSCPDLYGEAAELCGYCPTTGKAMVMKKVGGKYVPKYNDDVCAAEGYGLIPGDKCGKFMKDHPCITPYYASGPHTGECIKKLWENSGCTDQTPFDSTFAEIGKNARIHYKDIGEQMQRINAATRSTTYETAVSNSKLCYGNSNNIKACDTKYSRENIPHPVCLQEEYLASGGTKKGTQWNLINKQGHWNKWNYAKTHIKNISKYLTGAFRWDLPRHNYPSTDNMSKDEYQKTMERVVDLTTAADDYGTRYSTSMMAFGTPPPPPPNIKAGDTVTMTKRVTEGDVLKFEGIVTGLRGNTCKVLWYQSENRQGSVRKRENMSLDQQRAYMGWDGIPPSVNKSIKAWIPKGRLNLKSSCSNNKSMCKRTCKDKIIDILTRFPRPRDCIVGDWGPWSECSKGCGGGKKTRERKVQYPPKYGGSPCPPLTEERVCNPQPCLNPNFQKQIITQSSVNVVGSSGGYKPPEYRATYLRGGGRCANYKVGGKWVRDGTWKNAGSVQDCAKTFGEEGVISYRPNNGGQCKYTKTNEPHYKYTINGVRSGCKPEGWGGGWAFYKVTKN